MFQFTHPGRGATSYTTTWDDNDDVSIHAPREGCDYKVEHVIVRKVGFNSRTPGGVRLSAVGLLRLIFQFQFTHPGRGATAVKKALSNTLIVSIHAPREGCDWIYSDCLNTNESFNSRTPGGVRPNGERTIKAAQEFQFTHPGRGATDTFARFGVFALVSIHAPREGCDTFEARQSRLKLWFQFTHPGRGATTRPSAKWTRRCRFNSRTPGGVRQAGEDAMEGWHKFQFTHPGRGATGYHRSRDNHSLFQFTHPGRGAT